MTHEDKAGAGYILRNLYAFQAGIMIRADNGDKVWYDICDSKGELAEKVLAMLPPSWANVLRLIYCNGATVEDVSKMTGDIPFRVKNKQWLGLSRFIELWKKNV